MSIDCRPLRYRSDKYPVNPKLCKPYCPYYQICMKELVTAEEKRISENPSAILTRRWREKKRLLAFKQ